MHQIKSVCGLVHDILQCPPLVCKDFTRHHSWVIALLIQSHKVPTFSLSPKVGVCVFNALSIAEFV
jgi:hypothetical protein